MRISSGTSSSKMLIPGKEGLLAHGNKGEEEKGRTGKRENKENKKRENKKKREQEEGEKIKKKNLRKHTERATRNAEQTNTNLSNDKPLTAEPNNPLPAVLKANPQRDASSRMNFSAQQSLIVLDDVFCFLTPDLSRIAQATHSTSQSFSILSFPGTIWHEVQGKATLSIFPLKYLWSPKLTSLLVKTRLKS